MVAAGGVDDRAAGEEGAPQQGGRAAVAFQVGPIEADGEIGGAVAEALQHPGAGGVPLHRHDAEAAPAGQGLHGWRRDAAHVGGQRAV